MADDPLPPCGLYRTTEAIGEIAEGRLVYFHNHGDPGPGLYLPEEWEGNRAQFSDRGRTLPGPEHMASLEAVAPEGFYRVVEPFHCCDKKCQRFDTDMLVQLGYDAWATPIVFIPELVGLALAIPDEGTAIDRDLIDNLAILKVAAPQPEPELLH